MGGECGSRPAGGTRYRVAKVCVGAGWLRWWRLFVGRFVPKRKVGRAVVEVVDSVDWC